MTKIKQKNKWLFVLNLVLYLFLFAPSTTVSAYFNDTANIDVGIKLTLGNLALKSETNLDTSEIDHSGMEPVDLSTSILKNNGSLTGKLAYKITVSDGANTNVTDQTEVILKIDNDEEETIQIGTATNNGNYLFLKDSQGGDYLLKPNQTKEIPLSIAFQNLGNQKKNRDLKVMVTFLLVLPNATEPIEAGFYDTLSFNHIVKWTVEKEKIPNDWPTYDDEDWKMIGEVRYNDSQFKSIMYFSETEKGEKVRNLNDNILYIELPENKLKKDNNFGLPESNVDGLKIKAEVMENRRFIKLIFSFEKNAEDAKKLLSYTDYYTVSFNYQEHDSYKIENFTIGQDKLPVINKRLLLNTDKIIPSKDKANGGYFETAPIEITKKKKDIMFSYIQENYSITSDDWIALPLAAAKFTYETLTPQVVENGKLFKVKKKAKKDYFTIATDNSVDINKEQPNGKLKITLEGTSKHKLILFRDLVIAKKHKPIVNNLSVPLDETMASDDQEALKEQSEEKNGENEKQIEVSDKVTGNEIKLENEASLEESLNEEPSDKESIEEIPPEDKNKSNELMIEEPVAEATEESKPIEESPIDIESPEIKQTKSQDDSSLTSQQE